MEDNAQNIHVQTFSVSVTLEVEYDIKVKRLSEAETSSDVHLCTVRCFVCENVPDPLRENKSAAANIARLKSGFPRSSYPYLLFLFFQHMDELC